MLISYVTDNSSYSEFIRQKGNFGSAKVRSLTNTGILVLGLSFPGLAVYVHVFLQAPDDDS